MCIGESATSRYVRHKLPGPQESSSLTTVSAFAGVFGMSSGTALSAARWCRRRIPSRSSALNGGAATGEFCGSHRRASICVLAQRCQRRSAVALELGAIEPVPGDRAIYAHAAYIASDIASGYLRVGRPEEALALLAKHRHSWTSSQHRDHAVAGMRMLHALIAVGEYSIALAEADSAMAAYLAAPCQRARRHLALASTLVRERRRRNRSLVLQQLAGRIKNATQGVAT